LYIRHDELEERLLGRLRSELLQPEAVDMAIETFGRQLRSSLASVSNELTEMRSRKERLEREIRNFTAAIAENGHSKYILEEIVVREKEISGITDRLLSSTPDSIQSQVEEVRRLVEDGIYSCSGCAHALRRRREGWCRPPPDHLIGPHLFLTFFR
jgi:hypothetical protein